jgi:hypothetical protein
MPDALGGAVFNTLLRTLMPAQEDLPPPEDPGIMALDLLGPLGMARRAMKIAANRMSQKVHHGTPHDFKRFWDEWDRPLSEQYWRQLDRGFSPSAKVQRVLTENVMAGMEGGDRDFLLWDRPLSEQSEKVQASLRELFEEMGLPDYIKRNPDGQSIRATIESSKGGKGATEALKSKGIRGIKYADQGSRGAGEGTYNYVVFDPEDLEILKALGLTGVLGTGALLGAEDGS